MRRSSTRYDREAVKEVRFGRERFAAILTSLMLSGITAKSASTTSTLTPTEQIPSAVVAPVTAAPGAVPPPPIAAAVSPHPSQVSEDPFGSAPFSLPPGLREKASSLRKTGGKA